jgi:hypothetical protein
MEKIDIRKCYNDVLYWATSTQSKDMDYHITRVQEAVLRKLIHYSNTNDKVSYSNRVIAEHTFIGEETIRKAIPVLNKIGYVSTATIKISDEGEFKTRRTIYIKWNKLESILNEIQKPEMHKEESTPIINLVETTNETQNNEVNPEDIKLGMINETPQESSNAIVSQKQDKTIQTKQNKTKDSTQNIPKFVITDEKLKWIYKAMEGESNDTKEYFEKSNIEKQKEFFYDENGIWKIDDLNSENKYLIKRYYLAGSRCTLYNLNSDKDSISVNIDDLNYFLNQLSIGFGDMGLDLYNTFKLNGVPKRPLK